MEIKLKPCGDCVACCTGAMIGSAYGNNFHSNKPCVFLVEFKCAIYETRPETCRKFQCAWSQGLFPDWMKPTESNVLVSVEDKDGGQFLRVKLLTDNPLHEKTKAFLDEWTKENNTYYVVNEK
jgi:hypothetical protein